MKSFVLQSGHGHFEQTYSYIIMVFVWFVNIFLGMIRIIAGITIIITTGKEEQAMYEKRTDLAIEVRESFPKDDVEVDGVVLQEEKYKKENMKVTTVEIKNEKGAIQMKKPIGTYVTLEFSLDSYPKELLKERTAFIAMQIKGVLEKMIRSIEKEKKRDCKVVLLSGLGNRFATPDALGPYVLENITMSRHIWKEFSDIKDADAFVLCGISPGVMSQTGMETSEILKGIIEKVKPEILLVIDSLASRSVERLCRTIQITNTGISPGAGIGNNRNQINEETMGIPVIAIGVPTVVDAGTIIYESLEKALSKQGYQEDEIFGFFHSIADKDVKNLFVTPKDIDEEIRQVGKAIAKGLSDFATGH